MSMPSTRAAAAGPDLILCLLLPFAAGYFLSYLYRTVNAILGPVIAVELGLPDNALGLLTSAYFLAFGAAQIPLGLLLDRYGPRRVEAFLLTVAASGAVVFALAEGLLGLTMGRALIGLGVSACLMASMKAFTQWFSAERLTAMTGWIMAAGGLGALVAAKPLEMALAVTHWRGIVLALALLTLLVALLLWRVVPDKESHAAVVPLRQQLRELRAIFADAHFQRYAPMGFAFIGGFMAVQGLWASRWMAVLENLDAAAVAARLTWMGITMLAGFLGIGFFATRLVQRGLSLALLYQWAMVLAAVALGMICLWPQFAGALLWPMLGGCFSLANIAYSLVAARLTWMGITMLAGFLGIGFFATRLVQRGLSLAQLYQWAMVLAAVALGMICLWPQFAGALLWPLLGGCFSLANIAYSLVAQAFPPHWSGRASTAFNLLVFAGAFGLQWGIGGLVDALHAAGLSSAEAYRAAFVLLLGCQLLALVWFMFPRRATTDR